MTGAAGLVDVTDSKFVCVKQRQLQYDANTASAAVSPSSSGSALFELRNGSLETFEVEEDGSIA